MTCRKSESVERLKSEQESFEAKQIVVSAQFFIDVTLDYSMLNWQRRIYSATTEVEKRFASGERDSLIMQRKALES